MGGWPAKQVGDGRLRPLPHPSVRCVVDANLAVPRAAGARGGGRWAAAVCRLSRRRQRSPLRHRQLRGMQGETCVTLDKEIHIIVLRRLEL